MDKLRIVGRRPLEGEVRVSGAKNAALPIMCAALLTGQPLRLANVPRLMDVSTMVKILGGMGVAVERVRTGEKERFTDTAGVGLVIERMLESDHQSKRRRRRTQEEP